jgi:hypothetical protein
MKFVMTRIQTTEDILVDAFRVYLRELRYSEMFPNHANINVSNDHPFERLIGGEGSAPDLFPAVTIVASNDGEVPGMGKNWTTQTLYPQDIPADFDGELFYIVDSALNDLRTVLAAKGSVHGVAHSSMWRDSASFELWAENLQVKNELYNLVVGFLTGPKMLELKQAHDITVHSNSVQGQRSGYYNFDFGRTLYGGRVSFTVDYPVLQSVYDTDFGSIAEIEHSYREVLYG